MDKNTLPKARTALLLVDFINPLDFPGADDLAPHALQAARRAVQLRRKADSKGIPVIYANDNFGGWHSDFKELVDRLAKGRGAARELVKVLRPRKRDITVLKPMHSAFFGSPLEVLLDLMKARELIITGLATDMCVQFTAMDAHLRGYKTWVPADCTAAETVEAKATALVFMQKRLGCKVQAARVTGA